MTSRPIGSDMRETRSLLRLAGVGLALVAGAGCDGAGTTVGEVRRGKTGPPRPADVRAAPAPPARYALGRAVSSREVASWDFDVNPDGKGLPSGSGTHAKGATVYAQKCALCHGQRGEGIGTGATAYPKLIGRAPREGFPFGRDLAHVKTVGNYWPYATTVYDYLRRAMPLNAPGSLTPTELYSLTAFLLAENEIVDKKAVLNARTLPAVRMPARDRFVRDDRKDAPSSR